MIVFQIMMSASYGSQKKKGKKKEKKNQSIAPTP